MNQPDPSFSSKKTRAVLVSGFLGSGKTTLINYILQNRSDLAGVLVIVNEFGKLGIDSELILHSENDVVELTSGCICCTLVMDLKKCLLSVIPRFRPKIVLMEASGVADPFGVITLFNNPEVQQLCRLDNIITVLDADCWHMRSVFGELFFNQLQAANLIIVNKTDLIKQETLDETIQQLRGNFPYADIAHTSYCRVDIQNMGARDAQASPSTAEYRISASNSRNHNGLFHASLKKNKLTTFVFETKTPLDKKALKRIMSHLPVNVFRVKGFVKFKDHVALLNHTGGKSQWIRWEGHSHTRLTLIGWDIDQNDILNKLERCQLSPRPRTDKKIL